MRRRLVLFNGGCISPADAKIVRMLCLVGDANAWWDCWTGLEEAKTRREGSKVGNEGVITTPSYLYWA